MLNIRKKMADDNNTYNSIAADAPIALFTTCAMIGQRPVGLSCLSATLVYCGQTVGWIKMPLSTEVGLGSDDTVLDEDPAPSTERAQQTRRA